MAITLKDVAKRSGVSSTTVSYIINERESEVRISPNTRDKVLQIVEELGYLPNSAARSLVTKTTQNIGFIFTNPLRGGLSNPFISEMLEGAELMAQEMGYNMMISSCKIIEEEFILPKKVRERNIDGIITSGYPDKRFINMIKERGIPVVIVGEYLPDLEVDSVNSDNFEGAKQAVKHLINLGHRKIVHINAKGHAYGRLWWSPIVQDMFQGYKSALEESGIEYDPRLVVYGDGEPQSGYDAIGNLLDSGMDFSAVFSVGDPMAIGAIKAIKKRGLNIPADISVIGYGDLYIVGFSDPPLTTVRTSLTEMGRKAVERILELLDNSSQVEDRLPKKIILPTKLVIRESCTNVTWQIKSTEKGGETNR